MPYLIALVLVAIGGASYYFLQDDTGVVTPKPTLVTQELVESGITIEPNPPPKIETKIPTSVATTDYKDGTYETDVTYLTPVRSEYAANVSLTLSKDVVTGAKVTYSNGGKKDPNAARFNASYKAEVIGKDIDTLNLSRVGGASLTTAAFNKALVSIKAEAKS